MRHLIGSIDPTAWMILSSVVFLLAFVALVVWVYLPSRRRYYEDNAQLPLDKEISHERSKR